MPFNDDLWEIFSCHGVYAIRGREAARGARSRSWRLSPLEERLPVLPMRQTSYGDRSGPTQPSWRSMIVCHGLPGWLITSHYLHLDLSLISTFHHPSAPRVHLQEPTALRQVHRADKVSPSPSYITDSMPAE